MIVICILFNLSFEVIKTIFFSIHVSTTQTNLMKILQCFRLFLESCDIFAASPADIFTFKKSFYYSTASTKFFSLFVAFLSIFYFASSAHNAFAHGNPDIRFSETQSIDPPTVNFSTENNSIAFGLQNRNGTALFFNQSFFEIEMKLYNKNGGLTDIELELCNETKNENVKSFLNLDQTPGSSLYCLKDYSSLELMGTWDSQTMKSADLWIKPCNSTKGERICKNISEIADLLKESSFVMKYKTYSYDPLKDPFININKYIVGEYSTPLDNQYQPEIILSFAQLVVHQEYKTKVSIMDWFESSLEKDKKFIFYSSEKHSTKQRQNNGTDPYFHISFQLDKTTKTYLLIYDTWIDILSKVGGFYSCLKLVFNIMLTRYVRAALIQRVSNEIFDYQKIFGQLKANNPEELQKLHSSFKLKLSFWTYIKSLCWCFGFTYIKKKKKKCLLTQYGNNRRSPTSNDEKPQHFENFDSKDQDKKIREFFTRKINKQTEIGNFHPQNCAFYQRETINL